MKLWTRPTHYIGPEYKGHYVLLTQNRDSDALTRSNFAVALKQLGGESETVLVIRDSHFLCGWVEFIYIHESDASAVAIGNEIEESLESYPILDEMHFSDLEYTEAMNYWDGMGLQGRIDFCASCDVSIFVARRASDLPDRVYERLTR